MRADEITALLSDMRAEYPNVRAARRREPEEFLRLVEHRTAILIEIGKVRHNGREMPAYEFRHLTFQEYLASLALVDRRFPGRDREQSLAEDISPLAAPASRAAPGDDGEAPRWASRDNWREVLRLCVMSCNDDDVDSVLLAMTNVRADEEPVAATGPRALLAASCLADEPNVSERVAITLMDRLAEALQKEGDTLVDPTGTLSEVGASLWGPQLAYRLARAWISAPETGLELEDYISDVTEGRVPDSESGSRAWLNEQATYLASDDPAERIVAALSIMTAAYLQRGLHIRVPLSPPRRLMTQLFSIMRSTPHESIVGAWAIGWLSRTTGDVPPILSLSVKQKSEAVAFIKEQGTPALAVKFLLWTLDDSYSGDHQIARAIASRLSDEATDLSDDYKRLFRGYADPLIELLGGASPLARDRAALILGDIGYTAAIEPLRSVLADLRGGTRYPAALALVKLGDLEAIGALGSSAEDAGRVDEAVRVLVRLGESAIQPLLATKNESGFTISSTTFIALVVLGENSTLKEFHRALRNSSKTTRRETLWVVAQHEGERDDRILLSADADGVRPGIDWQCQITLTDVDRYAEVTGLSQEEVRERYERLQGKYMLRLAWTEAEAG